MPDGNAATLIKEFVPADLQDREYIKPWLDKPWDKTTAAEFFKKHDGIESLLGKRPAIPDAKTAKPEDLDKFFAQFAEEKAEGYEIPVEKDAKIPAEFIKAVQNGFMAGKINKVQAQNFMKVVNEYGLVARKAAAQEAQKKAADFDALSKGYLGQENKVVMERVRGLIKEYAPAAAKANVDKLTDEQVIVMGAIVDSIHKKYAPEDESVGGAGKGNDGAGAGGGNTIEEKRAEMRKLMGSPAFQKWQDPAHKTTVARVAQLAKEMDGLKA